MPISFMLSFSRSGFCYLQFNYVSYALAPKLVDSAAGSPRPLPGHNEDARGAQGRRTLEEEPFLRRTLSLPFHVAPASLLCWAGCTSCRACRKWKIRLRIHHLAVTASPWRPVERVTAGKTGYWHFDRSFRLCEPARVYFPPSYFSIYESLVH